MKDLDLVLTLTQGRSLSDRARILFDRCPKKVEGYLGEGLQLFGVAHWLPKQMAGKTQMALPRS